MKRLNVDLPTTFSYAELSCMTPQQINLSVINIKRARYCRDNGSAIAESAASTCLSSLTKIDDHYTYTADDAIVENEEEDSNDVGDGHSEDEDKDDGIVDSEDVVIDAFVNDDDVDDELPFL